MFGAVDDFDDAAAGRPLRRLLDPQQGAIADACRPARTGATGCADRDLGGETMELFIPLRGDGDQLAVAVSRDHVGDHHRRQRTGVMQPLALAREVAFLGELAQQGLKFSAVRTRKAERARNFSIADLTRSLGDESEKVCFRRQGPGRLGTLGQWFADIPLWLPCQSAGLRLRAGLLAGLLGLVLTAAAALRRGRRVDGLRGARAAGGALMGARLARLRAAPARCLGRVDPLPALASINATASSSVTVSGVLSAGSVALTP